MKYNKLSFTLTAILLFCVNLMMAQSTIRGTVTDSETGEAIPGANVVIVGTSEGTTADFDGNFTLSTNQDLPFKIEITSVGFSSQSVEVTSADQSIAVSMDPGESLEEIIVSASRRPQKLQEAPASVSLISSKDVENGTQELNPVRLLVNTPGVHIQQHSLNSINVEMRAGSGLFGTSTFPILDYRYLATPAADSFFSYSTGISNIDIAKIEVVRGANSAMYGPSVTSGVVHFLTKSAIDSPGSTLELTGGTMDTRGINFRHARSNDSKTFGYKFNLNYQSGQDFSLDPVEDAGRIAARRGAAGQDDRWTAAALFRYAAAPALWPQAYSGRRSGRDHHGLLWTGRTGIGHFGHLLGQHVQAGSASFLGGAGADAHTSLLLLGLGRRSGHTH